MIGSLRSRFLLVVLGGAVLPLAIAGAWLARSSVRSAEGLLRTQLDTSLTTITARIETRWSFRRGDLLGLAGNEVVTRVVSSRSPGMNPLDSGYLRRTYDSLAVTIAKVRLLSLDGNVRWTLGDTTGADESSRPGARTYPGSSLTPIPPDYLVDSLPIALPDGRRVGTLEAWIRLGGILPTDSVPILVKDAQLTVADGRTGRTYRFVGAGNAPRDADRYSARDTSWVAVHHNMTAPPLALTVAAPAGVYISRFEETAKLGLLVLLGVIALAMTLSIYFTARVTRSLERLVSAADAVAAGDLQRNVDASGRDEVGRLGQSFNTMTQSLRTTLAELSHREALAAVGEFAASLSHEVRNGLSAVRVDLQRVEEATPSASVHGTLVARALRNVRRLDSAVSGALAVARSARAELQVIDLCPVLAASHAAAEGAFAAAGAALSLVLQPDTPCLVRADAAALEQLFLNLLLNAAQALPPGGTAALVLERDGPTCTVLVRDDGPGMASHQLAQSGRPFYSSKRGGTGLGLSIATKIAEAHGGSLRIDSDEGRGTSVTVSLPLA